MLTSFSVLVLLYSVSVLVLLTGVFLCVDADFIHSYVVIYFQNSC